MSRELKNILFVFLKIGLLVLSIFYIKSQWSIDKTNFVLPSLNPFFFVFIMIIFSSVNWFLEIKKWQLLISKIRQIDFHEALKQSLSSFAVSMITPNRLGEYGFKILFFEKKAFKKVIVLQSIQSFSQLFATVFFGFFGCLYFAYHEIAIVILVVLSLFFFIQNFTFLPKQVHFYFQKIYSFSKSGLKVILTLSLFRYLVFSLQFMILLYWFGVENNFFELYFALTLMYLFSSVLPTLQFFDVIVKGSVGVFIFEKVGVLSNIVIQVTFIMWLFNMFLPYFFGLFYWLKFKPSWK